jgi:hypothetical protein
MLYLDFLLFDYSRIFVGSISNYLLLLVVMIVVMLISMSSRSNVTLLANKYKKEGLSCEFETHWMCL